MLMQEQVTVTSTPKVISAVDDAPTESELYGCLAGLSDREHQILAAYRTMLPEWQRILYMQSVAGGIIYYRNHGHSGDKMIAMIASMTWHGCFPVGVKPTYHIND